MHWKSIQAIVLFPSLCGSLIGMNVACRPVVTPNVSTPQPTPVLTPVVTQPESPSPPQPAATSVSHSSQSWLDDPYKMGVSTGTSALSIGKTAGSPDDWELVRTQWRRAISQLRSVPKSHPEYASAQAKIAEYQTNLANVRQQADRPATEAPTAADSSVIVLPGAKGRSSLQFPDATDAESIKRRVFQAAIKRREAGTPVIDVMFNQNYQFEMIVDTGASGTLITQGMANTLGVEAVKRAKVDTINERGIILPQGYVTSIEVDGAVLNNVLVAIANPPLNVGLLGHDFLSNFDVTVKESSVEFRVRR